MKISDGIDMKNDLIRRNIERSDLSDEEERRASHTPTNLIGRANVSDEAVPDGVRFVKMSGVNWDALGKGGSWNAYPRPDAVVHGSALDVHMAEYCSAGGRQGHEIRARWPIFAT